MADRAFHLLPDGYVASVKNDDIDSDELVVTVSSTQNPAFVGTNFKRRTLYIGDASLTYYTRGADVLNAAILRFMRLRGVRKVFITGGSKGGFGALLLGTMAAIGNRDIEVRATVFSPQTSLFPDVHGLPFPSYKLMMKSASASREIDQDLRRFGNLPEHWPENIAVTVYVGERNAVDMRQAELISDRSVLRKLPIAGHLSHFPFVVNMGDERAVRGLVDKAMGQGKAAGDPMAAADRDVFVADLLTMGRLEEWKRPPTLVDMADAAFHDMDVIASHARRRDELLNRRDELLDFFNQK